jgi:hypothetical protein
MAAVTGTLTEVGGAHLVGKTPQLIFTLNVPNAKSGVLYPTEPLLVTPASDGTWTANLASTTDMLDDAWYTLSIRWLDGGTHRQWDFPNWALQVPTAGGVFSDLFGKPPTNQRMVYVSLTPPDDPRPFTLWLEQDPTDPDNPLNTGVLSEWRNV